MAKQRASIYCPFPRQLTEAGPGLTRWDRREGWPEHSIRCICEFWTFALAAFRRRFPVKRRTLGGAHTSSDQWRERGSAVTDAPQETANKKRD